ncbi:MAG TPA: hypothetical protein VLC07_09220 [Solirubrobacterales bacterium]|nr:hypothetical protein [Solirubrobacterales bacterium]
MARQISKAELILLENLRQKKLIPKEGTVRGTRKFTVRTDRRRVISRQVSAAPQDFLK